MRRCMRCGYRRKQHPVYSLADRLICRTFIDPGPLWWRAFVAIVSRLPGGEGRWYR